MHGLYNVLNEENIINVRFCYIIEKFSKLPII